MSESGPALLHVADARPLRSQPDRPSPRGQRPTALFNWLLARGIGGTFILRIEDTDIERSTRASESAILDDLRWLGLDVGRGARRRRPHAARTASPSACRIYAEHAERLLAQRRGVLLLLHARAARGAAAAALAAGLQPKYRGHVPRRSTRPPRAAASTAGEPAALRFLVPAGRDITFDDAVRGDVTFDTGVIGDPVLVRSDGHPAYNFAVVVDDALMRVTHVIRGEDHISNTPRQLLLYEAFGYDAAGVRAPLAGARSGSQSALEAPRRDLGGGVPRQGLSAGSALQLSRADRVVAGPGRGGAARGGTRGAVQARRRGPQRRRVRRGQARVGEPSLPEGCGARRGWRALAVPYLRPRGYVRELDEEGRAFVRVAGAAVCHVGGPPPAGSRAAARRLRVRSRRRRSHGQRSPPSSRAAAHAK